MLAGGADEVHEGLEEIGVGNPHVRVGGAEILHRVAQALIVNLHQIVGSLQAPGFVLEIPLGGADAVHRDDPGEASGRWVPGNHQIHCPEIDQFL